MPEVLDRRALNRALLARQHLLARSEMSIEAMVAHLVAMQAQNPLDPYIGLWSRLEVFEPDELALAVVERRMIRLGLLRTTLHLATAEDALELWPVTRSVLERAWSSSGFKKQLAGADIASLVDASRALLEEEPMTTSALGKRLHARWPDLDPVPLGYVARFLLPIVQLPPRGVWGRTGRPTWTTLEAWLERPLGPAAALDQTVLRYLAAFGPATVADIRTWSWLTGLREVVERLRPQLQTFRDEAGRELFDLPDAPRPDPDTPAPPRFLPEYDNALLSHDDRSRVIADAAYGLITGWVGTFLIDGFVNGQWRIDRTAASATLIVEPFEPLGDDQAVALFEEGRGLLELHAPAATERRIEVGIARPRDPDRVAPTIGGSRAPRTAE